MKPFFVILGIMILCMGISGLRSESFPASANDVIWMWEFECGILTAFPHDVQTGETWDSGGGFLIGLNYARPVSSKLQLRGGISHQNSSAFWRLHHPLPYVMYMDVHTHVYALKFDARANYDIYKPRQGKGLVYVGAGLYGDVAYNIWGSKLSDFASGYEYAKLDMSDSFPLIMPGAQIAIGLRMPNSRLELRHWQDLKTHTLPGVPVGRQKRSGFGLTWSLFNHKASAKSH